MPTLRLSLAQFLSAVYGEPITPETPEKIPQESVATPSNWAVANLTRILSAMLQTRTILAAALSVAYMERVDVCALGYGVTLTDPTT